LGGAEERLGRHLAVAGGGRGGMQLGYGEAGDSVLPEWKGSGGGV